MIKKRKLQHRPPTQMQLRAIEHYIEQGCEGQQRALLLAGYSENYARTNCATFFNSDKVQKMLRTAQEKLAFRHNLDADWVIQRLMNIADSGKILAKFKKVMPDGSLTWDFTGATKHELSLIQELAVDSYVEGKGKKAERIKKFRVKVPDAKAALDSLARHLGLFNDKLTVGTDPVEALQAARIQALKVLKDRDTPSEDTVH